MAFRLAQPALALHAILMENFSGTVDIAIKEQVNGRTGKVAGTARQTPAKGGMKEMTLLGVGEIGTKK